MIVVILRVVGVMHGLMAIVFLIPLNVEKDDDDEPDHHTEGEILVEGRFHRAPKCIILRITAVLTKEFGPSSSGKTIIMGSAEGNVAGHDREKKVGRNVYRKKRGLQKGRFSPSRIATERDPLHRLAKFLSGQGLLPLSLDGGFLIVLPPLHLLEQAILEHQLFERLERWLDLIVAHLDLHGSNSLGDVSAVGRAEARRA